MSNPPKVDDTSIIQETALAQAAQLNKEANTAPASREKQPPPHPGTVVAVEEAIRKIQRELGRMSPRPLIAKMKQRVAERAAAAKARVETMSDDELRAQISRIKMAAIERKARCIVEAIVTNNMGLYEAASRSTWMEMVNNNPGNPEMGLLEEAQRRNIELDRVAPDSEIYQQRKEDKFLLALFE